MLKQEAKTGKCSFITKQKVLSVLEECMKKFNNKKDKAKYDECAALHDQLKKINP